MSTAKKLQTKLFGGQSGAKKGGSDDNLPAETRSVSPPPVAATLTPPAAGNDANSASGVTGGMEGLKIEIPDRDDQPEKREKDKWAWPRALGQRTLMDDKQLAQTCTAGSRSRNIDP